MSKELSLCHPNPNTHRSAMSEGGIAFSWGQPLVRHGCPWQREERRAKARFDNFVLMNTNWGPGLVCAWRKWQMRDKHVTLADRRRRRRSLTPFSVMGMNLNEVDYSEWRAGSDLARGSKHPNFCCSSDAWSTCVTHVETARAGLSICDVETRDDSGGRERELCSSCKAFISSHSN